MQAAGRIDDQQVGLAGLRLLNAVEHHRRRVSALRVAHNRHLRAIRPDLQLIARRRAERICRRQHDAVARILEAHCQLADGRRLAHAVHADDQHHHRPFERLTRHAHDLLKDILEDFARLLRVGDPLARHARFELLNHLVAGANAHVAHNQDIHQVLVEILVDRLRRLDQLIHAAGHVSARLGEPLPQAAEKPLLFFILRGLLRVARRGLRVFRPARLVGLRLEPGFFRLSGLLLFLFLFAKSEESHVSRPFLCRPFEALLFHRLCAHVLQLDAEHLGNALLLHRHAVKAVAALHRALSVGDDNKLRVF